jgi:hypothetical protein
MASQLDLANISLRRNERAFLAGGTEVGKSTLSDVLADDFLQRYYDEGARELVEDSKPRYRAEHALMGRTTRARYKKWDHGPKMPGSVVVDDPDDMQMAWDMGYRRVIVQGHGVRDIPRLVDAAAQFLESSRTGRPQLLRVDELGDFFYPNGSPRGADDALLRAVRAGRERGTACLYCSQRTKGIPTQVMEEMKRLYAFRLDAVSDAKRFGEMGAPIGPDDLPRKKHQFLYWYKEDYEHMYGPYTLGL